MKTAVIISYVLAAVLLSSSTSAQILVGVPPSGNFPSVAFGNTYGFPTTSSTTVTVYNQGHEGEFTVQDLEFTSPAFSTTVTAPFVLNPGQSKVIPITFNPTSPDVFNEELRITYKGTMTLVIPLHAVADCWSTSCEPKGPLCRINKGNETWQPVSVPNFFATVSPAIDEQALLHQKGLDYDLPIDFVLKIAGLAGVVQITPPLVCDTKLIHFTRLPHSIKRARFIRTATGDTLADGTIGNSTIHLVIPKEISGITIVGGGYSEFHFDKSKEPTLTIASGGTKIFEGPLRCINATFSSSTICNANHGTTRPNLNLEVQ